MLRTSLPTVALLLTPYSAAAEDWQSVPNGSEVNYCVDRDSIEIDGNERVFMARLCDTEGDQQQPVRYSVDCSQSFSRPIRLRSGEPAMDDIFFDDSPGFAAARFACEV